VESNLLVGQHSPSRPRSLQTSFVVHVPFSGGLSSQQARVVPWTDGEIVLKYTAQGY